MKIAVTGSNGFVGKKLVEYGCIPITSNILDASKIKDEIKTINPDVIIHCAAKTDVKWCEENYMGAFDANVLGTRNVADAFPRGLLIYLSTVHVFNGQAWYSYLEKHTPDPINMYGLTKYSGEIMSRFRIGKTIIVRISKIYDYQKIKPNLLKLWNTDEQLEFTDVISRTYVYLPDLVEILLKIANMSDNINADVIHIGDGTVYSEYKFWLAVCNAFGISYYRIKPRTYKLENEVQRPYNGGLRSIILKKYGVELRDIHSCLKEIKDTIMVNDDSGNRF